MINKKSIPKEVLIVIETLENKGFEAFIVGGCVRDLFLNKKPKDWDITTNAKPEEIAGCFTKTFYENKFGTVSVVFEETEDPTLKIIEITPYRTEGKYSDLRHPDEVIFSKKLEDDLKRRDFTINAIAYSPIKNEIIDLYEGQKDIKDKIIRTVGESDERFGEDALRILRCIRISSELDFVISHETLESIIKNAGLLNNVSRERIRDEFIKIIQSKSPAYGLSVCQKTNILPIFSKEIQGMVGVDQNKEAHLYDVWEHSIRALQYAAEQNYSLEVKLAALFHDIGKPITKDEKQGKTTFYGHDVVGAKVTREILENLNFSRETIEKVQKLVRWHMFFSDTETVTHSAARRLVRNVGKENIYDLLKLRKADRIGTGRPKAEPYRLRKFEAMLEEVMTDPISVGMLKIDGNDLKELGIPYGPKIGLILHALLEEVIENPELNTKDTLSKKVLEMNTLPAKELELLGKSGKETIKEEENKQIQNIRSRFHVK